MHEFIYAYVYMNNYRKEARSHASVREKEEGMWKCQREEKQ